MSGKIVTSSSHRDSRTVPGRGGVPPPGQYLFPLLAVAELAFLAIPADGLVTTGSPSEIAGGMLGLAGFMVVAGWFWLRVRPRAAARGGALAVAALAALAALLVLAGPGRWWPLPIYVAAVAGALSPARRAAVAVAGVALLVAALSWYAGPDPVFALAAVFVVALVGALTMSTTALISANVRLRAARAEIGRLAVSEERLRFARDVHDVLGHSLSLIVMKAGLSVRLARAGDERAPGEMVDVEQVALDALRQVRDVVAAYRTPSLDEELRASRLLLDVAGIRFVQLGAVETVPAAVDAALGWAVREGVTNVVRHSGAGCCTIALHHLPESVRLEIADDGAGAAPATEGNGLRGLRERMLGLRGEMTLRSSTAGFVLAVSIPVDVGVAPVP